MWCWRSVTCSEACNLTRPPDGLFAPGALTLVLMWLGRDEGAPEEFEGLVRLALERREIPTEDYLLDHPLVAEHWLEGMERLGLGGLTGE